VFVFGLRDSTSARYSIDGTDHSPSVRTPVVDKGITPLFASPQLPNGFHTLLITVDHINPGIVSYALDSIVVTSDYVEVHLW